MGGRGVGELRRNPGQRRRDVSRATGWIIHDATLVLASKKCSFAERCSHDSSPRVPLQLDLRRPLKRRSYIFAETQRCADEHGWEAIIGEYADEHFSEAPASSPPFDAVSGSLRTPNSSLLCSRQSLSQLVDSSTGSDIFEYRAGEFNKRSECPPS